MEDIKSFTGEYDYLANTYNVNLMVDGISYTNAESAFWAQRIKNVKSRRKLSELSGVKAKAKANNTEPIHDWESKKDKIMKKILTIKFSSSKELKKKLLDTGDAKLLNNVTYRDEYWGIHYGVGKNRLGEILMEVRNELK